MLYVVCCDLASDDKLNKAVMHEMESGSLPAPIVLEIKDDQLLAGFKTVFGAMELCEAITKIMVKPFQQTSNIRISLHVGPIHINPEIVKQELSGDVISMIERLHALLCQAQSMQLVLLRRFWRLKTKNILSIISIRWQHQGKQRTLMFSAFTCITTLCSRLTLFILVL